MADGKLTYDIDFNVNTESISDAIARAVSRATAAISYTKPSTTAVDAALYNLGDRLGAGKSFYGRVARSLGFGDKTAGQYQFFQDQGVNSLADFAALATSQKYGYTPSTTQTIINSAVASALHKSKKKPDMQWKFEMESLTNDIRAAQREQSKASLAYEYSQQGRMFADAAAQATTPEAQKMLLGRAASRYASIASRTLVESGAVSPDDAAVALSTAADLGALRSGIKTQSQLAAQKDRDYSRMEAIKAKQDAEEDAAWASRTYSDAQKQRDMERGFQAMGARSATEAAYNVDRDPDVQRWNYGASLYSAAQYAADAEKYPAGSAGRMANIALAKESMRGITISGMAKSGMHKDELTRNTAALLGLTEKLKDLAGDGAEPNGGGWLSNANRMIAMATAITNFGYELTRDVMQGRTSWLADMNTPYQTRRDVRQGWAMKYGEQARKVGIGAGAAAGAAVGTAILPGVGTALGALGGAVIGSIPGGVAEIWGQHNADEKKIGDSIQNRMVAMAKYRDLYGAGAEYNYAQLVENMGYASTDSVMGLTRAADMLPGAMMFGAVGEEQMMALSYMPNYWRGLMEGASTSELMSLYANDIMALPKQTRQYITSLLPGVNEELRAFAQSGSYQVASALSGTMKGYDEAQYGVASGWIAGKNYVATQNQAWINKNIAEETKAGNAPNYFSSQREWNAAMAEAVGDNVFTNSPDPAVAEAWNETRRMLGLREFDMGNTHGKLGDIIIQIDGNTIHQEEYSTEAFIRGQQSFVVGV